ncbi:hypothetical protein LCGC14_1362560 [marine sediment metagenome]|uniref:PUA domain-containing protein n=1 Tax=marine sediment metagenome TaxID=412755 RepID=A0A0F9N9U9_9ZZZZ
MNDTRIFRNINNIEMKIIATSFYNLSTKFSSSLDNLKRFLYISIDKSPTKENYPSIYFITNEQKKIINKSSIGNKIYAAGLYFGFIKKGKFYLSIEGAEYLYRQEYFSDFQLLQVNELGEKSILYGNNILKKMVVKTPENLKEKDFLLIFNDRKEIIAIALSHVNSGDILKLKPKDTIAINLSDKGLYLRKKQ